MLGHIHLKWHRKYINILKTSVEATQRTTTIRTQRGKEEINITRWINSFQTVFIEMLPPSKQFEKTRQAKIIKANSGVRERGKQSEGERETEKREIKGKQLNTACSFINCPAAAHFPKFSNEISSNCAGHLHSYKENNLSLSFHLPPSP